MDGVVLEMVAQPGGQWTGAEAAGQMADVPAQGVKREQRSHGRLRVRARRSGRGGRRRVAGWTGERFPRREERW
ncbi:hypothetical protein ALMP_67880 [Streptomyces sp. A012304]|nr:hypothetical protein ALMP_67880 [Streptomyces sp. A012304]